MSEVQGAKEDIKEKCRYGKDEGTDFTGESQGTRTHIRICYHNEKVRIGLEELPLREDLLEAHGWTKKGKTEITLCISKHVY